MRLDALLTRSARLYPRQEAVRDHLRALGFAEFEHETRRLAGALAAAGVRSGDRVAVCARNRWEYAALYFAASKLRAALVPLNWRLRAGELRTIVADAEARAVIAEPEFAARIEPERPALEHVRAWLALDEALPGWRTLVDGNTSPLAHADSAGGDDEVAVQMYTSGTTGLPKGALLTHGNVLALLTSWLLELGFRSHGDRFLQVTPLFHVGGMLMLASTVAAGVALRLLPEFEPVATALALADERITHTLMVPAMLRWLLSEPGARGLEFPDLRLVVYGAAPMPVPLLEEAMQRLRAGFLQGYGLTETAGVLTTLRPEDHVYPAGTPPPPRLASAGREILCARVRVVDEEDRDVAPGEVGEVVARGANISPGYWRREAETREAFRGGWFRTGDLARVDDLGYLTLVDRAKDMLLVGGENVYPREIEDVLAAHADVADSAVIGIPHDVWGEEVLALVVAREGTAPDPRALIRHCRATLARFKCPTRVELVESVPRNAAGKLQKALLREPYWAGRERRV